MEIAGNINNAYLDDGTVIICDSPVEASQMAELLTSGYSIVDYNLRPAGDVFATETEADEYLSILESLLDAKTQEERDEIIRICAQGTYPSLPEFIIVAIRRVGRNNAPALIEAISERLPDVFDVVYDYLMCSA